MSAKMAVSSSITWLIGWMRPISAGASRTGSVTSTRLGGEPRVERGALQRLAARGERGGDAVLQAVDQRALRLALVRRHACRASSAAPRPSRSCRARRRAPLRAPASSARGGDRREFVVRVARCQAFRPSLRHERQIGVGRLAAGLRQQAMDLAAMMGLVIEHMGDQHPARLGQVALRRAANSRCDRPASHAGSTASAQPMIARIEARALLLQGVPIGIERDRFRDAGRRASAYSVNRLI